MRRKWPTAIAAVFVVAGIGAAAWWDYGNGWTWARGGIGRLVSKSDADTAPSGGSELCKAHGYPESDCFRCNPSAKLKSKFEAAYDWCVEHSVPETQCELCDPFAKFKAKGDWCAEHQTPESQCAECDPSLAEGRAETVDWCQEHQIAETQCTICNPGLGRVVSISAPSGGSLERPLQQQWCEHGFDKKDCYRCDSKLEAKFKKTGDWCGGHGVPESQCPLCNPDVEAKVKERLRHSAPRSALRVPRSPWCEHGFARDNCFQCDPKLEAKFKETGDWCGGHGVPESQCSPCNPDVAAKVRQRLERQNGSSPEQQPSSSQIQLSSLPETESALPKSAFCTTHLLRVRLAGTDTEAKIGLKTEIATKRRVREVVRCNGEVIPNTNHIAKLSSRFDGIIGSLLVEAGQDVNKGEVVAVVESPALGGAKSEYLKTRQELAIARAVFEKVSGLAEQTAGMLGTIRTGVPTRDLVKAWQKFNAGEARTKLSAAANRIETAEVELERARKLCEHFKPVAEGARQMVALLRKESLTAKEARAKLGGLEIGDQKAAVLEGLAAMQLAQAEHARQEKLRVDGVGTERARLKAEKGYESAAIAYEALLGETDLSAKRQLLDTEGDVKKAERELEASRSEFQTLPQEIAVRSEMELLQAKKSHQLAENAFQVARRQLVLFGLSPDELREVESSPGERFMSYALKAPFDGVVAERRGARGEVTKSGEPIVVIADLSTSWVKLDVYEKDLPKLKVGQPVRFQVDGLKGANFEGKLVWLGTTLDDRARTVEVRAEVANTESLLRINMFGTATVLVKQDQQVITVPKAAVQWEGCCYVVFVKLDSGLFAPRKVRLGYEGPDFWGIAIGLREGEPVVTEGSFLLKTEILKSSIGAGCCE